MSLTNSCWSYHYDRCFRSHTLDFVYILVSVTFVIDQCLSRWLFNSLVFLDNWIRSKFFWGWKFFRYDSSFKTLGARGSQFPSLQWRCGKHNAHKYKVLICFHFRGNDWIFFIVVVVTEEAYQCQCPMHLLYHHDQQVPQKTMPPSKIPILLIDPLMQIKLAPTVMVYMEVVMVTMAGWVVVMAVTEVMEVAWEATEATVDSVDMGDMAPWEVVLVVLWTIGI